MQWKRTLRTALAQNGHRLEPIVRVSPRVKGKTLAQSNNIYAVKCKYCALSFDVPTSPGIPVIFPAQILFQECRKARSSRRKEPQSNETDSIA